MAKLHRLARRLALALAYFSAISCGALAQGSASGFDAPGAAGLTPELIRTVDVQKALIWTGHYDSMVDGDFGKGTKAAVVAWQRDSGRPPTGILTPTEAMTLVATGAQIRDAWGWTTYRNESVGYSIGYAGRVMRPAKQLPHGGIEFASSLANLGLTVSVAGSLANDFVPLYEGLSGGTESYNVHYKVRTDSWFVIAATTATHTHYTRAERRPSGVVVFQLAVPKDADPDRAWVLIGATANSFVVAPDVRPDFIRPERTEPPAAAAPTPTPLTGSIDRSGRTAGIQLRLAGQDPELKAPQVFERVSGSVYVVAALTGQSGARDASMNQGSAVAISRQDLLTNCHVIRGAQAVVLMREDQMMRADVVSGNPAADRCVLRAQQPLPAFVRVRPLTDIKIGEPVYAIGAPHGLELTLTQGLVSSKRTVEDRRYIQTDAPISPGSSGGGLFDAAGNLIGITTFFRKDAQNLNFAIAAEDYKR